MRVSFLGPILGLLLVTSVPVHGANERAARSLAYWRYQALIARERNSVPYRGTAPLPGGPLPPSWQISEQQSRAFAVARNQWNDWHSRGVRPFGYPPVQVYSWRRR